MQRLQAYSQALHWNTRTQGLQCSSSAHPATTAGRWDDSAKRFMQLSDMVVPDLLDGLFIAIPEELFRADISSTELRRAAQEHAHEQPK
jgi:hypothetical protein